MKFVRKPSKRIKRKLVNPSIKFDFKRMKKLIDSDGFLSNVFYKQSGDEIHRARVLFNTYVIGDSIMELRYRGRRIGSNPPPVVIYDKLLGIEAHKRHGKFKGQDFYHDFKKNTEAMVLGNPDGSLTIKSTKGKRLWKKFNY
jgi:hypothetical protein